MFIEDRTLRLRLDGRGAFFVSRETIITALASIGVKDIEYLWKEENVFEVFVTFKKYESTLILKELKYFNVNKDVLAIVLNARETFSTIRFHWVPSFIQNSLLKDYLESKSLKPLKISTLVNEHDQIFNGIREVVVVGNRREIENLPHILDCPKHNFQTLIKVPGRDPMCLKCRKLGHLRSQCTEGKKPPPAHVRQMQRDPKNPWSFNQQKNNEEVPSSCSDSEKEGNVTIISKSPDHTPANQASVVVTSINNESKAANTDDTSDHSVVRSDDQASKVPEPSTSADIHTSQVISQTFSQRSENLNKENESVSEFQSTQDSDKDKESEVDESDSNIDENDYEDDDDDENDLPSTQPGYYKSTMKRKRQSKRIKGKISKK